MSATPETDRLAAERAKYVAAGIAGKPFFVASAEGAVITDVDGRRFLDFVGGIGTLNLGHRNPAVLDAIRAQLDAYLHQCFSLAGYEPYIEVCRLLTECHPGDFAKKAMLVNSGAEAVENAIKIARHATKRTGIICLENAFHGRTLLAMTLTAKVRPYKLGFGPFAPDIHRAPGPYPYRGVTSDDAIEGLHRLFRNQVDPTEVAAIIFEPVQGEGGFIPMPEDYPRRVAEIAAEHGILVIADEVQAGMGRTGTPSASEHYGLEPDLATWGKSMGGGLPIAGVTGKAEVMDAVHSGGIGGTYGGNPVACAAAIVSINEIRSPEFSARAVEVGEKLRAGLDAIAADVATIGEVRGLGPMLALELVEDRATKAPAAALTARVVELAFERGLILMGAGLQSNVLRVLVPLVVTDEQIDEGLGIMREVLEQATAEAGQ